MSVKYAITPQKNKEITNDELISDLQRVASEIGETPSMDQYESNGGKYSRQTFKKRFGGWNNALKRAGLEVIKIQSFSEKELWDNLKKVWDVLERQPKYFEMVKPLSDITGSTYKRRFRGWTKALEAFSAHISKDGKPVYNQIPAKRKKRDPRFFSNKQKFEIRSRDNYTCQLCGKSRAQYPDLVMEADHIVPWSRGGLTTVENGQTLCWECNNGKSDRE